MLTSWGRHLLPSFIQFEVLSLVSDFKCNLDVLCSRIRILLEPLFQVLSLVASVTEGRPASLLPVGVHVWAPRPPLALLGGASCTTPARRGQAPGCHGVGQSRLPPLLPDCIAGGVGGAVTAQRAWDSRLPRSCWVGG